MFWRRLVFIVSIILLAGTSFAAKTATKPTPKPAATTTSTPQVIKAQTIQLTDSEGNIRASMGAAVGGPAVFRLFDKDGNATVTVDSDGAITILNSNGKPKITVGQMGEDYGVGLYDAEGKIRADVCMADGEPLMSMRDASGNVRSTIYLDADEPYIIMSDGKKDGASFMSSIQGSIPSMAMWDGNGKLRTSYKLASDSAPFIMMADEAGESCMELSAEDGIPSLSFINQANGMSAFLGFTSATSLSLGFTDKNDNLQAAMYLTDSAGPNVVVNHPNGKPASRMGLYDDGVPYFLTTDENETALWRSQ